MPERYYSPEYRPIRTIEGEPIRTFLEITIDEADPMELDDIVWPDHQAALMFRPVGEYQMMRWGMRENYPLHEAVNIFNDIGGNVVGTDLTAVTQNKQSLFTGSRSGFFMHDPASLGHETDYYVIGISPYDLEDDIRQNAGTYHELGHAVIADCGFDVKLLEAAARGSTEALPPVSQAIAYGHDLRDGLDDNTRARLSKSGIYVKTLWETMRDSYSVDRSIRLFHERNAWACGIRLQRSRGAPTGFSKSTSLGEYARYWLDTYARDYGDRRFVEGLRFK